MFVATPTRKTYLRALPEPLNPAATLLDAGPDRKNE
jgi:hypothetical protein